MNQEHIQKRLQIRFNLRPINNHSAGSIHKEREKSFTRKSNSDF